MKNPFIYYTAIILPLAILLYALTIGVLQGWAFIFAISFYTLVYRTYVDYARVKPIDRKAENQKDR